MDRGPEPSDNQSQTPDSSTTNDGQDEENTEDTSSTTKPESKSDLGTADHTSDQPEPGSKVIDYSKRKGTGIEVGQVPENLELENSEGETIGLHDYCNQVVVLDSAAAF